MGPPDWLNLLQIENQTHDYVDLVSLVAVVTFDDYTNLTEILDIEDGSVIMASPMNFKRAYHGMGVITINGEDKLVVIGGSGSDGSVELYNIETKKWEISNIRLNGSGRTTMLSFLQIKLADIISKNI